MLADILRWMMSDDYNLGSGLENVCRGILRKLYYASNQLEDRERTIINVNTYEVTALIWALDEFQNSIIFKANRKEK